jgi:hypothetical protein
MTAANLFGILALIVLVILYIYLLSYQGNLAWRHPDKLKSKYVADAERWPKWFPLRNYYLSYYNTNIFVWVMRIVVIFEALILLGLLTIVTLGWLGWLG